MKNEKSQAPSDATSNDAQALSDAFQRAHLRVDVAKQRMRLAKEELKRARKRFKEAKRMSRRARKEAAAARKAWKRLHPKAAKKAAEQEKAGASLAVRRGQMVKRAKNSRRKTTTAKPKPPRGPAGQSVH